MHLTKPRRAIALLAACAATTVIGAQSKPPVTLADYGKFETLAVQPRAGLSPDGRWLAYGINRSNRDNELRIVAVAGMAGTGLGVAEAGASVIARSRGFIHGPALL